MHAPNQTMHFGETSASLYCEDVLSAASRLVPESIDLVLTSPPYCIGKEYEKTVSLQDFESEIRRVAASVAAKVRSGGSVCWQVGYHVTNNQVTPLDFLIHKVMSDLPDLTLRNRVIWSFGHGTHSKVRFSGRHETVLWYTKGDNYYFDLDAVRIPQKYPGKRYYKGPKKGEYSGNPLGKNPEDVWIIPNVNSRHAEKTAHPCQFPIALAERLIKSLCPINGTVMDPYLGSGSTAIAAIKNGRNFVGSELNPDYVGIARERLLRLHEGTLRMRPDMPVVPPNPSDSVAQRPTHFKNFGE